MDLKHEFNLVFSQFNQDMSQLTYQLVTRIY